MSDSEKHEVEDPVELMLKRTGCIELHYKVQVSLNAMFIKIMGKISRKKIVLCFSVWCVYVYGCVSQGMSRKCIVVCCLYFKKKY